MKSEWRKFMLAERKKKQSSGQGRCDKVGLYYELLHEFQRATTGINKAFLTP
jgi:hypothetical protein